MPNERIQIMDDGPGWMTLVRYWLRSGAGAPEPDRAKHGLLLIPWSIGNRLDITLHAVRCVRRLRCFLAEDPDLSREQFAALLGAGVRAKRFWRLPDRPDPKFLKMVLGLLKSEDVGLVSGGGIPCFVDPGAWVVRELRRAGVSVTALAGASSLASVLCLSGIEWRSSNPVFSFAFFPAGSSSDPARARFLAAASRADEPLVVFLDAKRFRECVKAMAPVVGGRRVTVFFDLTRGPKDLFPYADQVRSMSCRAWLKEATRLRWERVGDVSLLVHAQADPA